MKKSRRGVTTRSMMLGSVLCQTIRPAESAPRLLYRLWVAGPDAKPIEPLTRQVWVRGPRTIALTVAHNDPVGTWTVHVREAISGRTATVAVDVAE